MNITYFLIKALQSNEEFCYVSSKLHRNSVEFNFHSIYKDKNDVKNLILEFKQLDQILEVLEEHSMEENYRLYSNVSKKFVNVDSCFLYEFRERVAAYNESLSKFS